MRVFLCGPDPALIRPPLVVGRGSESSGNSDLGRSGRLRHCPGQSGRSGAGHHDTEWLQEGDGQEACDPSDSENHEVEPAYDSPARWVGREVQEVERLAYLQSMTSGVSSMLLPPTLSLSAWLPDPRCPTRVPEMPPENLSES